MKSNWPTKISAVISAFLFIMTALGLSYFHVFDNYELETLDFRFLLRPRIPATDKVIVVEIGEDTIERLGRFPFDRSYHALLVKALSDFGAKAVIFDIFFSEPSEDDAEFAKAIKEAKNVYLPFVFDIDGKNISDIPEAAGYLAENLKELESGAKGEGHINIAPDRDGKFRRVPLYVKYKGSLYPYISFLMSCDYLGMDEKAVRVVPGKSVALTPGLKIPLDENSNMLINFAGRWGESYRHYSYFDILQSYLAKFSAEKPALDTSVFKDKICIVGLTAAGTVDLHPNPFEVLYPGVGIHAEVFNSVLNKRFIARAPRSLNLAILVIFSLLISLITMKMKPLKAFPLVAFAIFVFISSSILLFSFFGIWMDLFYPVLVVVLCYLSLTLYRYIGEWKRRLVLENELDIAKKIQESFLPRKIPSLKDIDMAATMFTARKVGGDLYDFLEFEADHLGVMVGDVSGKGIPASLFMAMVTGKFKFFAKPDSRPEEVLSNLNSLLVKESASNLFVTMFYAVFDMSAKTVRYSNGGHLPLFYLGRDKDAQFLDVEEGTPLGMMDGPYSGKIMNFNRGDIFVFYTDGITEAMNPKGEMYTAERLAGLVRSNKELSSKALITSIEKDLRKFEPKAEQHDDMTLVVVKIR